VLGPDVVLRADPATVQAAATRRAKGAPALAGEVRGAAAVVDAFSGRAQAAQLALIDAAVGAVWAPGGKPRVVFGFTTVVAAPPAQAAIAPDTWYTVVSKNSGKYVDARGAATANDTVVQQFACNQTASQQWQFQATSAGYYRVNAGNSAQVWDVAGVSSADGGLVHLWAYGGGANQQWQAVEESGGGYHFLSRNSGKCLDVPSASSADSVQLQQYACNGSGAQSFTLSPRGRDPAEPRRSRPRAEGADLRSADVELGHPGSAQQRFPPAGDQLVRLEPLRVAVQARLLQRRRQRRVLHPGARARPLAGRRHDQRRRARRS
jgi:hypothetical protein